MGKVSCECGKSFKNENSMNQHRRDSPKHQQHAEADAGHSEPGTSRGTRGGATTSQAPNNKPLTPSIKWYSSRYRTVRFPWAARKLAPRPKAKKEGLAKSVSKEWPALVWKDYGHTKKSANSTYKRRDKPSMDYKIEYTEYKTERNQNWGLCDKDCGWCGRCMNGKIF